VRNAPQACSQMNDATSEPVISFEDVHLGFVEADVLQGISFRVAPRETKVLIGESNSGKTLALKLAAGLLKPTSGHVRVLGRDLGSMSENDLLAFRRQIGFVFQEGALFDSMTVEDNVAYRLREDGVDGAEIEERVRQALRFVELEDVPDKLPDELSGGMRRRVAIARAIVSRPPIVLYDSPTAGLDPVTSQTIITLILRLRDDQGMTSILATHRLQDAFGLANYHFDTADNRVEKSTQSATAGQSANDQPATNLLLLRNGRVYFEGGQQAVLNSQDAYLKEFLV
jgi:phospholipid/cholesterol/gamma-HCH transport system ATP-binding protein